MGTSGTATAFITFIFASPLAKGFAHKNDRRSRSSVNRQVGQSCRCIRGKEDDQAGLEPACTQILSCRMPIKARMRVAYNERHRACWFRGVR